MAPRLQDVNPRDVVRKDEPPEYWEDDFECEACDTTDPEECTCDFGQDDFREPEPDFDNFGPYGYQG